MAREQVGTAPSRPQDTVDVEYVQKQLLHIPGVSRVFGEIPEGTKDGHNTQFSLQYPLVVGTTAVFRNGLRESLGIGYSESLPRAIIFDNAPLIDDDLSVDYIVGQVED